MNLLEIRKLFREMGGRYDLVNDDFTDDGADFYINEAVRWLDRRTDMNRAWGTYPQWVPPGTWVMQFPSARAVRQIRVDSFTVCVKSPIDVIGAINQLQGALPVTIPTACAVVASARVDIPEDEPIPTESYREFFESIEILSDSAEEVNTAIFDAAIPHSGAMISVAGMFYEPKLIEETDVNFWSRNHSMILVNAAIRQTFVTSGNKAMLEIYNQSIESDIVAFGLDRVEEAIFGRGQMRSNF